MCSPTTLKAFSLPTPNTLVFKRSEMTSGYMPGIMPEKGLPGFDQILRAPWSGLG
jgi:hypothetical protein